MEANKVAVGSSAASVVGVRTTECVEATDRTGVRVKARAIGLI